ncbi:MAG: hypothetical protein RLZZ157_1486, partial [Pseudomonadota bacterium]
MWFGADFRLMSDLAFHKIRLTLHWCLKFANFSQRNYLCW